MVSLVLVHSNEATPMANTQNSQAHKHSIAAVIGLLVLSIALRPAIISVGPILLLIQQHFHLSYTQAALLTSIPDVCMGVFALMVPNLARRFGIDRCVVVALLLPSTRRVTTWRLPKQNVRSCLRVQPLMHYNAHRGRCLTHSLIFNTHF